MARKTILNKTIKKKISAFTSLLKRSGIPAEKIILFGSHAKGKGNAWSDIDLCVVSRHFAQNPNSVFKKIWQLAGQIDSSLEPIPFTPKELSNPYSTLASEIRSYGIRIA